MTRAMHQWVYVDTWLGGISGHARLLQRRGWSIGEPVRVGRRWFVPCSRLIEGQP